MMIGVPWVEEQGGLLAPTLFLSPSRSEYCSYHVFAYVFCFAFIGVIKVCTQSCFFLWGSESYVPDKFMILNRSVEVSPAWLSLSNSDIRVGRSILPTILSEWCMGPVGSSWRGGGLAHPEGEGTPEIKRKKKQGIGPTDCLAGERWRCHPWGERDTVDE